MVDRVAWYVLRRVDADAVAGAEFGPLLTTVNMLGVSCSMAETAPPLAGIFGALRVIGGGLFFPPGAPAAVGACLTAIG